MVTEGQWIPVQVPLTKASLSRLSVDVFTSGAEKWNGSVASSRPAQSSLRPSFLPNGRWVDHVTDETGLTAVYISARFPATGAQSPISKGRASFPALVAGWEGHGLRRYDELGARHDSLSSSLTTEPTFAFGNPVVVPSGTLQTGGGSVPNAPRRFDMAPDGAVIGTVVDRPALVAARRPAHERWSSTGWKN